VIKEIAIIIPHKGLGDIIFHHSFIKSIYQKYNRKIVLFACKSTHANIVYNRNRYIKKIIIIDLKRPNYFFYIFKMIRIFFELYKYKFEAVYYTGNSKWHKIIFALLRLINNFKLYNLKNDKKYIIKFLSFFLKNYGIKESLDFELNVPINVSSKFKKKISMYKKPWVFLSIDTSEDQIHIPKKHLETLLSKLKSKYATIFINTSAKNESKTIFLKDDQIIKTSKLNIIEVNYIIKNSNFFIGNESGPAILASLLKKKSIIFLNTSVVPESMMMPNPRLRKYFHLNKIKNNFETFLDIL
jgi:ADP-heptose:LPS heptosyltransferase